MARRSVARSLLARPAVEREVREARTWYEREHPGLGREFLAELRLAYGRILDSPEAYEAHERGIRRALLRRFPYGVYFLLEEPVIIILAVLHLSRDPNEWRQRA